MATARDPAQDALAIARHMLERHGHEAAELMEARARANRDHGAAEDAAFWMLVAEVVRALQRRALN